MKTSHIMCISKILTDLCFTQQKLKNKNYFYKSCLQWFSARKVLKKHKEDCLTINGAQSVRFEKGTIEFKNYFKQIPVPFKVYAYFKCNLKSVESYEGSFSKNIKLTFIVVLLTNLFVLMINLVSQLLYLEVKMLLLNFSKKF